MKGLPLEETRQYIQELRKLFHHAPSQFQAWENALDTIQKRLQENMVRLAIIGTIKSGKSSLSNALLKQDLLKRGAGVLTSIITRVRYGSSPGASIRFKSWPTIDQEVQNAYVILAQAVHHDLDRSPSLNKPEDRQFLKEFLEKHSIEFSEQYENLNQERILLESFLQGYSAIHGYLKDAESNLFLKEEELQRHQEFVSQKEYAVYMQDIQLDLPLDILSRLEISDCQGSDSPNPHHFAMVQSYLAQCSLVIYVISSRTGLRQADLVLLQTLKQLGLLQHTLFVINLDFTEHESLEDAQRVLKQQEIDLRQWVGQPRIFGVSALYQLFSQSSSPRSPRVESQLQLWRMVTPLIEYHQKQWAQLEDILQEYAIQHAEEVIQKSEASHWYYLIQKIWEFTESAHQANHEDTQQLQKLQETMQKRNQELQEAHQSLQAALNGAYKQLRQTVGYDVNLLFEKDSSFIVSQLHQFIQNYQLPSGFSASEDNLSMQTIKFYKNLQHQLLIFVTEELNAPLLDHLKSLQNKYLEHLQKICAPAFNLLPQTATSHSEVHDVSPLLPPQDEISLQFPEVSFVMFSSTLDCHAREKLKSFYLLGKRLFQKKLSVFQTQKDKNAEQDPTLMDQQFWEELLVQLKQDASHSLEFDILNYRENIKYLYLCKGLELLIESIIKQFTLQMESALIDCDNLYQNLQDAQQKKEDFLPRLNELREILQDLPTQTGFPALLRLESDKSTLP
ncbi:MAG: dynamin family protein [SAR324 cluster bacterium]|nr:dynamin family protein [SAR324 cluster bacterium]